MRLTLRGSRNLQRNWRFQPGDGTFWGFQKRPILFLQGPGSASTATCARRSSTSEVFNLLALVVLSVLVLPIAIRGSRTVTRAEGAFLLLLYLSYLTWRLFAIRAAGEG